MTSHQAKEILMVHRPGTGDGDDPEVKEALELIKSDPQLARWFDAHTQMQAALRGKFREIRVPDGLKEQILSERKVHTQKVAKARARLVAAAGLVVLLLAGMATFYLRPQSRRDDSFSNFRNLMVRKVVREYPKMDLETNDLTQIQQYLAQHGAQGDYILPANLQKAAGTGCAIIRWHGKTVSMVCLNSGKNGLPTRPDLFLFIIERSTVEHAPSGPLPQWRRVNDVVTASWSNGNKAYVLAGAGDEELLRPYF